MSRLFKKTDKRKIESKPCSESIPNLTNMMNQLAISTKPPTKPAFGSPASSSASPNIVGPNEKMENDSTAQPPKENDVGRAPPGKKRRNNLMSSIASIGQDEAYNRVCNFLKDDAVGMVGIYGMGGVGKTTLMKKIEREYLKPSHFKVIWVVVSKTLDINRIQEVIMGNLNLDFNKHYDASSRADEINDALGRKIVAILFDDIWECLDIEMVGILDQEKLDTGSFKLIFTTRSKAVCDEMQSDELINVQPLGWDDSWALFKESVGSKNDIESCESSIVEISKDIARECKGLPLALKVIGRAMASRRRLEEWRHALDALQHYPDNIPAAKDLFTPLKFSFDSLSNQREKGCFLYTCFYPEDRVIEADMLIECWIGEGILTLNGSYQEAFDEGMNIFGTLQAACLFETLHSPLSTRIHDVIRDMGIWIANSHDITNKAESRRYSVWCENYKLPEEAICSNLTTLIINREWEIGTGPNKFSSFASMSKLRVIKLTGVEFDGIPTSIGELTELRHLELIETNLERLPDEIRNLRKLQVMHCDSRYQKMNIDFLEAIGELTELRRLVCRSRNIPVEVGNLKKLEELRIDSRLVEFPLVICQLVNLKKLFLKIQARVELPIGFGNLNKLEIFKLDERSSFHCVELIPDDNTFRNMHKLRELSLPIKNFKILSPSFFQGLTSLKMLSFRYHGSRTDEDEIVEEDDVGSFLTQSSSLPLRILNIDRCPTKKFQVPPTSNYLCFPWLEELHISKCDSLKHISGLEHLQSLVALKIGECPKLEEVIQVAGDKTLSDHSPGICFPKLEKLDLAFLLQLKSICSDAVSFPSIRVVNISYCDSLKHISGLEHLQSLVELIIDNCPKLEEVIQVAGDKTLSDHSPAICFPKLEKLGLFNLPQLKSICSDAVSFPSIRVVNISFCDSLKHISGLEHLQSLVELEIKFCPELEEVIQVAGDKTLSDHSPGICFPKLEKLGLWHLPQLKSICSDAISFPSIRVVDISSCDSLKHISGLEHLQSLVELEIRHCAKLEEVIQVAGDKTLSDQSPGICFPKLEKLDLWNLPQLKSICSDAISFPSIRVLTIRSCDSLKHISGLVHLQSLVELEIGSCAELEEVIQVAGDKTLSDHSPAICFPKLEKLWLWNLSQLKSICSDAISFPSLRYFRLDGCPDLVKKNKAPEQCIIRGGREWCNKLQWQDEDLIAALSPFFRL